MSSKVLVLGIDGATFTLLKPWVEQGRLPNLARLLQEGAHGPLRSTIPPYSAQAWCSMMTGKGPAKHGVVDFFQRQAGSTQHSFVSSPRIQGEAIWDTLSRHGKRVGAVNVPLTYPPAQAGAGGYMVSGFMTPKGREDYTYPPELRQEILSVTGQYDPDPWDLLTPDQGLPSFVRWMEVFEQVARYLHERHPVDVYINVIQALDQLQHTFWDLITDETAHNAPQCSSAPRRRGRTAPRRRGRTAPRRRGARFWPLIERCYQSMDQAIGQRLGWLDGETTLFLVSDHGFQHVDSWFHVNRWLAENGWLQFAGGRSSLARLGLTREGIKNWVRRLDAFGLRRHVGRFTRAAIANKLGDTLAQPIDWTRTVAYSGSRTSEGIYVNLKGREPQGSVEPAEYAAVRERIMAALSALVDPRSGQRAVSAVYRREDVQSGPFLPGMPDIFFSLDNKPYLSSDSTTATRTFESMSPDDVRGRHHSQGILAIVGPHIVPGLMLLQARIVDVAPTLLYAMNLPIPADMDGRVLEEAFDDEYRRSHPVRREEPGASSPRQAQAEPVYTDEEETEMQRRLHGLGYLS